MFEVEKLGGCCNGEAKQNHHSNLSQGGDSGWTDLRAAGAVREGRRRQGGPGSLRQEAVVASRKREPGEEHM